MVKYLRKCEYNEAVYQLIIDLKNGCDSVRENPV